MLHHPVLQLSVTTAVCEQISLEIIKKMNRKIDLKIFFIVKLLDYKIHHFLNKFNEQY